MKRRHALSIAIAAGLGALVIAALPALAGAKDDHGHGHHHAGERHHHHGFRDRHENVGTISAFDASSGQLTIALLGGGSISGQVTGATEIKCEGRDDSARLSRDGGSNSGPGSGSGDDNGGQGEEEPGDDQGEGVEPGDDNDDQMCTTADLTVGTVVYEVDREFDNGVATFDEIELAHHS